MKKSENIYFGIAISPYEIIHILALNIKIAQEIADYYFKRDNNVGKCGENNITAPVDVVRIFNSSDIIQGYLHISSIVAVQYISRKEIIDEFLTELK